MKIAVIGSRGITLTAAQLSRYMPPNCTELVSDGADGVGQSAAEYAATHQIKCTVFLPQYEKYGCGAPFERNRQLADYADLVLAFWDGHSKGISYVTAYCARTEKSCRVIPISAASEK